MTFVQDEDRNANSHFRKAMYGKDRNLLIDCLRGFSILIVVGTHGALTAQGYFGVSIFFVISGFLITRNTFKRYGELSRTDILKFYRMRAARILPCLSLFLATMTLLFWIGVQGFVPAKPSLISSGIFNAIIFQYNNFYLTEGNVDGMYAWSPLWSLSIEETFYLLFPLACILSRRNYVFVIGLLILIAYGPVVRIQYFGLFRYFGNADLLSFGCLAAILERQKLVRFPTAFLVVGSAIILAALALISVTNRWGASIVGIGAAFFLLGSVAINSARCVQFITAPLAAFGRASYEIYLFHAAMIIAIRPVLVSLFGPAWQSNTPVSVGVTTVFLGLLLLVGTFISRYFTEPLNQFIRQDQTSTLSIERPKSSPDQAYHG
jgi:peptidoglycan/LPS O-acetylase OafA/YrhL